MSGSRPRCCTARHPGPTDVPARVRRYRPERKGDGETVDAWPFLIGRGRDVSYRAIVAPDFLVTEGSHRELAPVAADATTTPSGLFRRPFRGGHTMFFRTVDATDETGHVLVDRANRPIGLAVGVIVDAVQDDVDPAVFAAAERFAFDAYHRFRATGEHYAGPVAATALSRAAAP